MSSIKSIVKKRISTQRLYNLAVADDESYVANGIVVHNCKSYLSVNLKGTKSAEKEIGKLAPSSKDLEKYITLSEDK